MKHNIQFPAPHMGPIQEESTPSTNMSSTDDASTYFEDEDNFTTTYSESTPFFTPTAHSNVLAQCSPTYQCAADPVGAAVSSGERLRDFFGLSQTQRAQALERTGVGEAAFLIRDALMGLDENPSKGAYDPYKHPNASITNTISIMCRRFCSSRIMRRLLQVLIYGMLLVTYFEPPNWCRNFPLTAPNGKSYIADCKEVMSTWGPAANNSTLHVQWYPNTSTTLLTTQEALIIQTITVIFVWFFLFACYGQDGLSFERYFRPGGVRTERIVQVFSVSMLTLGLIMEAVPSYDFPQLFAPFWRLSLMISFDREARKEIYTLFQLIPEVVNILILMLIFITFYAWVGVVMFYNSEEGEQHFPNLIDGMWTLWTSVTTVNYPDVMMPAYNKNRLATLYFVFFMVITFFFMMNVVLASVVNAYDNELDRRKDSQNLLTFTNLSKAFALLDPKKTGTIDRDTVMALFYILNEDFPEFRTIPYDEAMLLFAVLDKDGTSLINKGEFLDFGNVMLLKFVDEEKYKSVVEKHFPKIYFSGCYQAFSGIIQSSWFEYSIDILLVLNAIVVAIQSYPYLVGEPVQINPKLSNGLIDTAWEKLETMFTIIYCLEISGKILVYGWKRFAESNRNLFDMVVTLLAVFATAYVYYPNNYNNSVLIRFVVMARVLRLARLLVVVAPFQMLARVGMSVLARAINVITLLFCIAYTFSSIGVLVFGGRITRDPFNQDSHNIMGSLFQVDHYWANNFNDMFGAMNVLFNLLVINNWNECSSGFHAVFQSRWPRYFFLSFYFFGVILANNLVIAFIINAFMKEWYVIQDDMKDTSNRGSESSLVDESEALIYGGQAKFDAQRVTGTKTQLSGRYVAKLGRRQFVDESDEILLRTLFTHTPSSREVDLS